MKTPWTFALLLASVCSGSLSAAKLVTPETVAIQKKATKITKLKNGIPVVFRQVPGSDILNIVVNFDYGVKDLPKGQKSHGNLMFSTMTMSASGFPKTKVFRITEKYALELGCGSGTELSTCSIGTLNEHWPQVKTLFGALITKPSFTDADLKLQSERNSASIKGTIQSSDRYVNEVVNRVFYGDDHPYRMMSNESLEELKSFKRKDIVDLHQKALNAARMAIVVVGSYDQKKMLSDLNSLFSKVESAEYKPVKVNDPKFKPKESFSFEDRDIPTAYIRAKFEGLGHDHRDSVAQKLMIKVLDEELGEEIRTKRSLSYSVWAYVLQLDIGIGMLSASTSKPKETLEAMTVVLNKLKKKALSRKKLEEYKTVYATKYFLTLETHSSLASALSSTFYHKKSVDSLYEMPLKLDAVTPKDIQRLAKKILNDMRLGIVFNKKKFSDKWASRFLKSTRAASKKIN